MDPVTVSRHATGTRLRRSQPANYRHIRVLRWTFRREGEAVVCELALTGEDREYELRAPAEWNPTHARSSASTMP